MRRLARLALVASALTCSAGQGDAIELLTGDGYLVALAQDEPARKAADDYLAGTLDGLIVTNEVTASDEGRMFCLTTERAGMLDNALLRQEFTDWLRDAPSIALADRDPNALPLAILGWAFLSGKFPCAETANDPVGDEVRSRLLQSVPAQ